MPREDWITDSSLPEDHPDNNGGQEISPGHYGDGSSQEKLENAKQDYENSQEKEGA